MQGTERPDGEKPSLTKQSFRTFTIRQFYSGMLRSQLSKALTLMLTASGTYYKMDMPERERTGQPSLSRVDESSIDAE